MWNKPLKTTYIRSDEEFMAGRVRLQNINYPLGQLIAELTSYNSIDALCKDLDISPNYIIKGLLELVDVINSNEFRDMIIGSQELRQSFTDDYKLIEYEPTKD